jgi:hypothetical protein
VGEAKRVWLKKQLSLATPMEKKMVCAIQTALNLKGLGAKAGIIVMGEVNQCSNNAVQREILTQWIELLSASKPVVFANEAMQK